MLNTKLVLGNITVDHLWEVRNKYAVSLAIPKIKLKNERADYKKETEAHNKAEIRAKDEVTRAQKGNNVSDNIVQAGNQINKQAIQVMREEMAAQYEEDQEQNQMTFEKLVEMKIRHKADYQKVKIKFEDMVEEITRQQSQVRMQFVEQTASLCT